MGITKKNNKIPDLTEGTVINLNEKLNKHGSKNSWWPWYFYFPYPYRDWSKNVEPWLDINSGKMAKMVVDEIVTLTAASEAIIDEAERVQSNATR